MQRRGTGRRPHSLLAMEVRGLLDPERSRFVLRRRRSLRAVVVLVNGNWTSADEAVENGWEVYQTLRQDAGSRAFRCVIWSWPSDRQARRFRPDVQLKLAYSSAESYYLAAWLAASPAQNARLFDRA